MYVYAFLFLRALQIYRQEIFMAIIGTGMVGLVGSLCFAWYVGKK